MRPSKPAAIAALLQVMARLRSPTGCPWDRRQTHRTLRFHAVEEVYELMDAIDARDDHELIEELGDLLLQVVFHCQLAKERGAFDFAAVSRRLTEKLIRRHPHVFGRARIRTIDALWAQWDHIKKSEKAGTRHERHSAFDGIPKHLPALLRAEQTVKKARKAGLAPPRPKPSARAKTTKALLAQQLFRRVAQALDRGWSAEALLRDYTRALEQNLRRKEKTVAARHRNP
jgi:uncharacterized protein YabN with tetrapyrrole methylase and pyrophosphatase domain